MCARNWGLEIDFGLRWLADQLYDLLEKWDAPHWEYRLKETRRGPTERKRPTINQGELEALKRNAELIRRGLERLGVTPGQSITLGSDPEGDGAVARTGDIPDLPENRPGDPLLRNGSEAEPAPSDGRKNILKKSLILAVFREHRDWSDQQIAEAVGADRGYVWRVLRQIRDALGEESRRDLPRGAKGRDGELDAWCG